jgi:PHS family inorganic phosphate transporter-like MFS transporter
MLTGIGSTLLLPETRQRTLEEISNENQDGFIEGVAGRSDEGLIAPTLAHDHK